MGRGKGGVRIRTEKNSLKTKFLGGIFLLHQGRRRRDIPDPGSPRQELSAFGASFCCFRLGMAGMSKDLSKAFGKALFKKTLG